MRIATFRGLFDDSLVLLNAAVPKITFTSALGPPIEIDTPFAPAGATSPSGGHFLPLLKPKLTVYTAADPYVLAPWGDPGDVSWWPWIKAGAVLVAGLAAYGAYKLVRDGLKTRKP